MEWHINPFKWYGSETSFKSNGPGLALGLLNTLIDNLDKVGFDVLQRHALHKCRNVNILGF